MAADLLKRYEATLVEVLRRVEDHHRRAGLCARVLEGETWEQVLGVEGTKPSTTFHLGALSQLDELIGEAGIQQEQKVIIERLQDQMLEESAKRDKAKIETELVNLPMPTQQQIPGQAPSRSPGRTVRSLGTQFQIPVRLVKCPAPPSPTFSGNHLVCTWGDLVWAAVSVGRPGLAQMIQHGAFSWYEMAYRLYMMEANLELTPSAELAKTSAFTALDPSEKTAVSYFFGLAFVKLFAELALDIPWLLHVDRYRVSLGVTTSSTTSIRPDLIGRDVSGDWFAFEAKGRSGNFSTSPIAKGKYQLAQLLQVQGTPPRMRLVAQTYFKADRLAFYCEDPDADPVGYGIDIPDSAYFSQYYEPIIGMLGRHAGRDSFVDFTDIGLRIGLDPDVHRMAQAEDWEGIRRWAAKSKHHTAEDQTVGRDGLIVQELRGPREPDSLIIKAA